MILRSSLFWLVFAAVAALALAAYGIAGLHGSRVVRDEVESWLQSHLEAQARLWEQRLADALSAGGAPAVDADCKEIGRLTGLRFTVVAPDGSVFGDSDADPDQLQNHADRPEVQEALRGSLGTANRVSRALGSRFLYVAIPLGDDIDRPSVLRVSVTMLAVEQRATQYRSRLLLGIVPVLALAFLTTWAVVRPALRFMRSIRKGLIRVSRNNLGYRVEVPGLEAAGETANAFNRMAARVGERQGRMALERRDSETLLASMTEGIIALDPEERVVVMNRAAGSILDLDPEAAPGRMLPEVVRNPDLLRLARTAISTPGDVEGTVHVAGPDEKILSVEGTRWVDPDRGEIGALLVVNDVTRVKQLENMRRDFVANVSHELRTPITSIRGFAETLLDENGVPEEDARRFHEIIARESSRLHEMLEDLLILARVEKESEEEGILLEDGAISAVLDNAVAASRRAAEEREIPIEFACREDLRARIHPQLLEQAVTNLISNAIRYSDASSPVLVEASAHPGEVVIAVTDRGRGIPPEHLPRIFERFYRVSAGRERRNGGTGLGLAIVKHIAQAHGGYVSVESDLGKGSRFEIHLPRTTAK